MESSNEVDFFRFKVESIKPTRINFKGLLKDPRFDVKKLSLRPSVIAINEQVIEAAFEGFEMDWKIAEDRNELIVAIKGYVVLTNPDAIDQNEFEAIREEAGLQVLFDYKYGDKEIEGDIVTEGELEIGALEPGY